MNNTEQFKVISNAVPHVAEKMQLFWGSEYFPLYVSQLFLDTRDGKRQGFPKDVHMAIFELQKMHDEQYPQKAQTVDAWTQLDKGRYL